jgi:hypothetical protein
LTLARAGVDTGLYGADILPGHHEAGEWIACPDCGQEHEIVAAVPVDVVENLTVR